jgi:hypothetical protein
MTAPTLDEQVAMVTDVLEVHAITLATAVEILRGATGLAASLCTYMLAAAYQERCRSAERPGRDDGWWTR